MPRGTIDYSNTIIYKITCKNPSIKQIFVGHTTNLSQKKHSHKTTCNDPKKRDYNLQMYKIIRQNGGWENWEVTEIARHNCKNATEAKIKECEQRLLLSNDFDLHSMSATNTFEQEQKELAEKEEQKKLEELELQKEQEELEKKEKEEQQVSNIPEGYSSTPDFNINIYTSSTNGGTEEVNIDMNEITERDIHMLTNLVLQLIKQNLFFKQLIIEQNKRIIELSKQLGIPVEEDSDDEEEKKS